METKLQRQKFKYCFISFASDLEQFTDYEKISKSFQDKQKNSHKSFYN